MGWSFALVNNRLAEIFFEKSDNGMELWGHAYVEPKDFKSLEEQRWIEKDTKRLRLVYKNGSYKFRKGYEIAELRLAKKQAKFPL